MGLDLERLRAETGATGAGAYLNNGRVSPMPAAVRAAIRRTLDREYCHGWTAREQQSAMDEARAALADLLHASAAEIAITQSASYSINLVLNGLAWQPGDNLVLTDLAYRAVAQPALRLQTESGVQVRFVASEGLLLDAGAVLAAVDSRTRLVVVPWIPMFCGVVQPVAEIGRLLRNTPALFAVNATQATGQLPVDVGALDCDLLFGTSRKWLRGPRGLGFLYVRERLIQTLRPSHVGHPAGTWTGRETVELSGTIDRLHLGDYPYTLLVGLAAAVRYALATGVGAIQERNRSLGRFCREQLAAVSGVEVFDAEQGTTGTVPCSVRGKPADAVVEALGRRGVTVCTIYAEDALLGLRKLRQEALVRVSVHYWNTEEEIHRLASELRRLTS